MNGVILELQLASVDFGSVEVNIAEAFDGREALWCLQSTDLGFVVFFEIELMICEVCVLFGPSQPEVSCIASCPKRDDLLLTFV